MLLWTVFTPCRVGPGQAAAIAASRMEMGMKSLANSRKLGWLSASVLALVLSSSAWALDFDREIARQERSTVVLVASADHAQPESIADSGEAAAAPVTVKMIKVKKLQRRAR